MNFTLLKEKLLSPFVGHRFSVKITPKLDAMELIDIQRRQIRNREYVPIGRLARIMLGEGCLPNVSPDNPHVGQWTAGRKPPMPALEWMGQGPMLARTKDGQDYLIVGKMIHPPPLDDPTFIRPDVYGRPNSGNFDKYGCRLKYKTVNGVTLPILDEVPKVPQSLLDCAYVGPDAKWIKGPDGKYRPTQDWYFEGPKQEKWMCFQPVHHVLFYPLEGVPSFINGGPDHNGDMWCFLYDREHEEGHLVFGRKELGFYRVMQSEQTMPEPIRQQIARG